MLPRLARPLQRHPLLSLLPLPQLRRNAATLHQAQAAIVRPQIGSVSFLTRRSDRPLPDPIKSARKRMMTIPLFLVAAGATALVIFNYQKANSSVVASTFYALRMHPLAREVLGDRIQFDGGIPLIGAGLPLVRGKVDQLHGEIDIRYRVKGTKGEGDVRFRSTRKGRTSLFVTEEWYLETKDGRKVMLLEGARSLPKSD